MIEEVFRMVILSFGSKSDYLSPHSNTDWI